MPPDGADRRVALGPVAAISDRRCVAAGDGRIVVARIDDRVVAFQSHCLHQKSPLDGGLVMDGVLICPHHFWRYRTDDGTLVGSDSGALEQFEVEIVDCEAFVSLPDEPPALPLREQLLERARSYDRAAEFERRSERTSD